MVQEVIVLRWIALAGGLAGGAANFWLLAAGCKRLLGKGKRGALFILGGVLVPVGGLTLCAWLSPALLPWFGCACGGMLSLLAIARMLRFVLPPLACGHLPQGGDSDDSRKRS